MLGGQRDVGLVNDLSYKPTLGQTAGASFEKPFEQISQVKDYIFPGLSSEETRKKTADRLSVINELTSDPRQGLGQQSLNAVSNIVGGLLPTLPLAIAGSAAAAPVAGAIGFGARALALEAGSDTLLAGYIATQAPIANLASGAARYYLPKFTIGQLAAGSLEGYAGYKGMIIPEHFSEHYNAVENSLDKNHAIEDWASDNYGFLLGGAPLAAGYVLFKGVRGIVAHRAANASSRQLDAELTRLLREHEDVLKANQVKEGEIAGRQAKVSELQDHLQQAEDMGFISSEMHEWYLDYLENPNDMTKVHEGGLNVLKSLQIPYDRVTGRVWNEVLSRDGIKNMQSALFDQGITQFSEEERQLLSHYVIQNELDGYVANMRENPNMLDAIQGMTHHIGMKIDAHTKALMDFEFALTKELGKGIKKDNIFSQKQIYNHLRKNKIYHAQHVPYEVPHAVRKKLALERKLNILKGKKGAKYRSPLTERTIEQIKAQIKELKLQTPDEELTFLKDKLMPEGKLSGNFRNKKSYYRLEELSQVWPNAKFLLDRIHMEAMNGKQKGLNEILKKFTEMVDLNASRLANPDGVKRYLHSRIERAVPFVREFEQLGIKLESNAAKIKEGEANLKTEFFNETAKEKVSASELAFAKEQFELNESRFKQLNENETALSELIKCALGE